MKYITHKRFKGKAICGDVNLPAMTECESDGSFIQHDGKVLCAIKSENARQYFSSNDDGRGLERGRLTQDIQKLLAKRDDGYQSRWDKVWADPLCRKYKRVEHNDYWLWNHKFFNAPISDLEYIYKLIRR